LEWKQGKEEGLKRTSLFLSLLLASWGLWLLACGGSSPDGLPKAFVEGLAKGNAKLVKKLATESFANEALRGIEQFKGVEISISKFKVKEKKDAGENKKNIRVEYISQVKAQKGKSRTIKLKNDMMFHLVKVKKNWLIEKISEATPAEQLK
jgi:hypothetical protein